MANNIQTNGRIIYVDPNDNYGRVGDNPLTPDYTDYCLYCNLLVEPTSRLRNMFVGETFDNTYSLEADLLNDKKGISYTSFFSGASKGYNYLTTDYTDIHFNSIKKKTFIEGLQISSIDISYQNWMCPFVTINMVDIRGGGLMGREEETHLGNEYNLSAMDKDEEGQIIDNIYNSFMSFPYPKFKLQVKGYYGRAVTYQLMCNSFNCNFDSNTGNFNITVTFIGYEFGCLNDLPLLYVMAAPYTKTGKEYWQKMKNSDKWNLFLKDGKGKEPPIKLVEFFKNIHSAIEIKDDNGEDSLIDKLLNTSLDEINKVYTQKKAAIENLKNEIDKFYDLLYTANSANIKIVSETNTKGIDDESDDGDKVLVIFSSTESLYITKEVAASYNKIGELISAYASTYPSDNIGLSLIPNTTTNKWETKDMWKEDIVTLPLFLQKYENKLVANSNELQYQISMSDGEYDLVDNPIKLNKIKTRNNKYSFNSKQSVIVYDYIKTQNYNAQKPYCGVIVFKGYKRILTIIKQLDLKKKEYDNKVNDGSLIPITKITNGVTPYIGNFFKMVFCHVDTFIHTLWSCVDDIYREINSDSGNRTPNKLGITNMSNTDVPKDIYCNGLNEGVIPPFPAIYSNYGEMEDASSDYLNTITKVIGWVGDIKDNIVPWREKQLIDEYYEAIKLVNKDYSNNPWLEADIAELSFNLLPCFLYDTMEYNNFNTREGLAYYTAIMSQLVVGCLNDNNNITPIEAELIGAILAKNIYDNVEDKERLSRISNGNSLANDLYNVATINNVNGNTESKKFEIGIGNTKDKRHRIFNEKDNNVEYSYMLDINDKPIIPLCTWTRISENFIYKNNSENATFTPKYVIDGEYVTNARGNDFIKSINESLIESFMNNKMFSIWVDSCNIETILTSIETYKTSGENIGNYNKDKFTKNVIKKYWLLEDNFTEYQSVNVENLTELDFKIPNFTEEDASLTNEQWKTLKDLEY